MVLDKPSWQHGRALEYGGLAEDAMTSMSALEIAWNAELIEEEAATAVPRGSASSATRASPAAATASTFGSAGAGTSATPAVATGLSLGSAAASSATPAAASAPTPAAATAPTEKGPPRNHPDHHPYRKKITIVSLGLENFEDGDRSAEVSRAFQKYATYKGEVRTDRLRPETSGADWTALNKSLRTNYPGLMKRFPEEVDVLYLDCRWLKNPERNKALRGHAGWHPQGGIRGKLDEDDAKDRQA